MWGILETTQCSSCAKNSECAGQERLTSLNEKYKPYMFVQCSDYVMVNTKLPAHSHVIAKYKSCFIKR